MCNLEPDAKHEKKYSTIKKHFLINVFLFIVVESCYIQENRIEKVPAIDYDSSKCIDAVAFPIIPSTAILIHDIKSKISDLNMTNITDTEKCNEYMFEQAEEMLHHAIISSGFLEEEFENFKWSKEMFTGSASQPPGCVGITLTDDRTVCELPVIRTSSSGITAKWSSDGKLEEVHGTCGGFVDYEHPIKDCSLPIWNLETCGGIFSVSGVYGFEWDSKNKRIIKIMIATCEKGSTTYGIPICDDFITGEMIPLCGKSFCVE